MSTPLRLVAQRQTPVQVVSRAILDIATLRMDLSLAPLVNVGAGHEVNLGSLARGRVSPALGATPVCIGLRSDPEVVRQAVASAEERLKAVLDEARAIEPDEVFRRAGMEPVKVLASQEHPGAAFASTGIVVDGAIRTWAAQAAGMTQVPADLVVPAYPDTPLEGLFLAFNWAHGQRLSAADRDAIVCDLARRHRERNPEDRDAVSWARWLSERVAIPLQIVLRACQNEFQERTRSQIEEAKRLLKSVRGADTRTVNEVINRIASEQNVSRTAIQHQARKLGVLREATPPAEATALNLFAESIRSDKFDLHHDTADLRRSLAELSKGFQQLMASLNAFIGRLDPGDRAEYARVMWHSGIDDIWRGPLRFARLSEIYKHDQVLAERDADDLEQIALHARIGRKAARAVKARLRAAKAAAGGRRGR